MVTKTLKLTNNIEVFEKINPDTPRVALCFNMRGERLEKSAGVTALATRLMMQGTKNLSAEELAAELDNNAIDLSVEARPDYIRVKFVCLNEDFEKGLSILTDIVTNSTFEDFDKERAKLEGELVAELDSPRVKVSDIYYGTMFKNHPYGYTNTKILENLPNITHQDVLDSYSNLLQNSKKVISVVGDIDFDTVENLLQKYLGEIPNSVEITASSEKPELGKSEYSEIIKSDANQAHIIKGWIVGSSNTEDYAPLLLLNVMLGASGLSSRLFLELREKKGLAYVVRSSYETFAQAADFFIYIATEPKNIEVSLEGFKEEIEKIKSIPVSQEELENAKNNLFGKWAFSLETNNNQAVSHASAGILGLGFDFNEKVRKKVHTVTVEQIQECANKYFTQNSVLSILKP